MRTDHTRLDLGTRPNAIARRRYRAPELRRDAPRGVYVGGTHSIDPRAALRARLGQAVPTMLAMAAGAALVVAGIVLARWV